MRRLLSRARSIAAQLGRGDWATLAWKARLLLRGVDLWVALQSETGLSPERAHWSSQSGGPALIRALRGLGIGQGDSVVDLGSGKGGALIAMSALPFSRMAGVELSSALVAIARDNFRRLGLSGIDLICSDAAEFTDYDAYSHIYMFNPFPATVMVAVVRNIQVSLQRAPRDLTILYRNPTAHSVIMDSGSFDMSGQLSVEGHVPNVYRAL